MLEVTDLTTRFKVGDHKVTAVDSISFSIPEKTVVGLVGESGSGKSVTALSMLRLLTPNGSTESGQVNWYGRDILKLSDNEIRSVRGGEIGMIFQNPLAALNPVFTIGNQMIETIMLHKKVSKEAAKAQAVELLKRVRIPDAETRLNDYPHQFSLGMCQRIMIALTLAMSPKLLIADEPTASLDVTIGAQIMALLNELKEEFGMSVLMISHDLGVIAQHCDYIMVMYLGKIIEQGTPEAVFGDPKHPYTQALLSSIPIPDPTHKRRPELLKGDVPSPMNLPSGCRFHPRCSKVMDVCSRVQPEMAQVDGTKTACFLYEACHPGGASQVRTEPVVNSSVSST